MKFEQYQQIKAHALAACTAAGLTYGEPKQLNPILLAYIGDVVFSLYVRLRLLPTSGQVRVIHDLGSKNGIGGYAGEGNGGIAVGFDGRRSLYC